MDTKQAIQKEFIKLYAGKDYNCGAAKTSAFYAVAPFIGVGVSLIVLGEKQ